MEKLIREWRYSKIFWRAELFMVKLNIIPKGGKFDVIDSKERVIYRIKQGMNLSLIHI